ncbi:hypothetical protein DMW53_13260 [Serratia marcescens]|nr:hypothetical protein DMW53_13260 [Serratia marcescens]PYB17991.1 hypothetical protein DMW55_11975 [Serratia marcescens]
MGGIEKSSYAKLKYVCGGLITEDLCEVIGPLDRFNGFFSDYYDSFKNYVNEEDRRLMVFVRGFFGLGFDNFNNFNFISGFDANYRMDVNVVIMPENQLEISLLTHESIGFDVSDLFLIKRDVLKIKDAIEKGIDMERSYHVGNVSDVNSFKKWFSVSSQVNENDEGVVIERVSAKARDAIRTLVNKLYPELKDNPTKLADILTAEAEAQGVICEFNKSTVSNWLKK